MQSEERKRSVSASRPQSRRVGISFLRARYLACRDPLSIAPRVETVGDSNSCAPWDRLTAPPQRSSGVNLRPSSVNNLYAWCNYSACAGCDGQTSLDLPCFRGRWRWLISARAYPSAAHGVNTFVPPAFSTLAGTCCSLWLSPKSCRLPGPAWSFHHGVNFMPRQWQTAGFTKTPRTQPRRDLRAARPSV